MQRSVIHKLLGFTTALTGLALAPTATAAGLPYAPAASFPLLGEWEWMSFGGIAIIFALLGAVGWLGGKAAVGWIPLLGPVLRKSGPIVLAAGLVLAAAVNPGGLIAGSFSSSAASVAGDDATSFDAVLYESTSDVTFYFVNKDTKATLNPVVGIYEAGKVTEKAAFEGSATPLYSGTASSGTLTLNGLQTQTIGCTVDVHVNLASYYEDLIRSIWICHEKNALSTNDISVPTIELLAYGTASLSKSDTTLTCTVGTQCDYTLTFRNSVVNTGIRAPAVKFATGFGGATLDAVGTGGQCEIVEVSSTQYVVYTGAQADVGSLSLVTCPLKITRVTTPGTFNLTGDDLFQKYGASGWNTNANVRGVAATSATQVTFA